MTTTKFTVVEKYFLGEIASTYATLDDALKAYKDIDFLDSNLIGAAIYANDVLIKRAQAEF